MKVFESDTQWLVERMGEIGLSPTETEIDFFIEKVALLTCDGFMSESHARLTAYRMIVR